MVSQQSVSVYLTVEASKLPPLDILSPEAPYTGDTRSIAIYFVVMILSAAALFFVGRRYKKDH